MNLTVIESCEIMTECKTAVDSAAGKLEFIPYSEETLSRWAPWLRKSPYLCSDISVGSFILWQCNADPMFCVRNNTFVIREEINGQPAFSYPYGDDPDGMIDLLIDYVRKNGLALRFFGIGDSELEKIKNDARPQPFAADYEVKWSDYIYDFATALDFQGRKFRGQRNHINKFTKLYGEPVIRRMMYDDIPAVRKFLEKYKSEHTDANKLEQAEFEGTLKLLEKFSSLGLIGAVLTVGDEIAAFTIGEVIGECLIIHIEKALRTYEGAYPVMYRGFVRLIRDIYGRNLKYINREDDSGDPGIRTSKLQYQPVMCFHKRLVHVGSPACEIENYPVLNGEKTVLTGFRESDKPAYLRLSTDVENNLYWGYDYREDIYITSAIDGDTFYDAACHDMKAGDSVNLAIRESADGEMIGEAILWNFTYGGKAELGCRILKEYQGRGLGSDAYRAALRYAQKELGLDVWARCYKQNTASYYMIVSSGLKRISEDETFYYFGNPD